MPAHDTVSGMRTEYHHWYSGRTSREMGLVVYGHWGPPLLVFPTSGGDEWEMDRQGMIGALADFIDGGRVKIVRRQRQQRRRVLQQGRASLPPQLHAGAVRRLRAVRGGAVHPPPLPVRRHRHRHDGRVARRVPRGQCALQAPRRVPALLRPVGRVRHEALHGRALRRQLLLQQPRRLRVAAWTTRTCAGMLAGCEIHLATGHGPWEDKGPTYRMAGVLARQGHPPPPRRLGRRWAATTGRTGSGARSADTTGRTGSTRCASPFSRW